MKIKQGMRYDLNGFRKAATVYYIVVLALLLVSYVLVRALAGPARPNVGGMDMASVIFLFVVGLNAYKTELGLFVQSGISRRTMWLSFLLSAAVLSAVMAVIDSLLPVVFSPIFRYTSLYASVYNGAAGTISLVGVAWSLLANLAALTFGFFVTTGFYRMNRATKVLVSVGIPVTLFVILPIVEAFVPSINVFTSLLRFYAWAMGLGFTTQAPLRAVASMAVFSAVMAGLSYLLVFRAPLKEA